MDKPTRENIIKKVRQYGKVSYALETKGYEICCQLVNEGFLKKEYNHTGDLYITFLIVEDKR